MRFSPLKGVLPVLFWGVVSGACVWGPLVLWQRVAGGGVMPELLRVTPLPVASHLMLFGKSALVGTSWILGYFALRNLPLSIPLIGLTLLLADFAYFSATSDPDALIALISPMRRSSLLVAFAAGAVLFGEKNIRAKAICVVGILVGVILLYAGN